MLVMMCVGIMYYWQTR